MEYENQGRNESSGPQPGTIGGLAGAGTMPGYGPVDKAPDTRFRSGRNEARVNRLSMADEPMQVPLRERVYAACADGERNARRYNRALRAAQLIEQHPEVAELLELLREF